MTDAREPAEPDRSREGARRRALGRATRRRVIAALLALACAFAGPRAESRDLWSNADSRESLALISALEGTGVGTAPRAGTGTAWAGLGFARLRLDAQLRAPSVSFEAAYDDRLSVTTGSSGSATVALPSSAPAPFRLAQIGGDVLRRGRTVDYQELDRASARYASDRVQLVAGRQAIGWGRGVLFSAADIFAPFTPLEIDREWRRGVDALDVDVELSHTSSVGLVSAFGTSWEQSALAGRLRGFVGQADAEALVAKRAEDQMVGATGSMAAGNAELHAEAVVVRTPGDVPAGAFAGRTDLVPKAVLGASNNFLVGSGLKVTLEYHYSGFGAARPSRLPSLLANPAFVRRLARGDTQIVGRQAAAALGSYTLNTAWSAQAELLQSLIDPSGVVAATAVWDASESVTVSGSAYLAYGLAPLGSMARSQFGSNRPTLLVRVKLYE